MAKDKEVLAINLEDAPPLKMLKRTTPADALKAAMSPSEVLARPHDYEKWYNGMREEALNG